MIATMIHQHFNYLSILVVAVALLAHKSHAFQQSRPIEDSFESHWRAYGDSVAKEFQADQVTNRRNIFEVNKQLVLSHNANHTNSYELKLGHELAMLSEEEFTRRYLSTLVESTDAQSPREVETSSHHPKASHLSSPPPKNHLFSWPLTRNVSFPVRSQGSCGACWAFASVSAIEGWNMIHNKDPTPLSVQNIIDCAPAPHTGCRGHAMSIAYNYVSKTGVFSERAYPFKTLSRKCKNIDKVKRHAVTLKGVKKVFSGTSEQLRTAVEQYPVSASIVAHDFHLYGSGILRCKWWNSPHSSKDYKQFNHAVTVVGYQTDATGSVKAWQIKNSWGANWGEKGYAWVSAKPSENCGISTFIYIPQ